MRRFHLPHRRDRRWYSAFASIFRFNAATLRRAVTNEAPVTALRLFNGHSMVGKLHCVLVCSPRSAGWNQPERAARWRELGFHHPPDFNTAQAQHEQMRHQLEVAGVEIWESPPALDLTLDAVYAHDALLPTDFGFIIMRPGKPNRVSEGKHQSSFCLRLGQAISLSANAGFFMPTKILPPGTTEAGDMVWLDEKTLLIGRGYRTNNAGIAQIRDLLSHRDVQVLSAPLPYGSGPSACLHLMSLISLLDERTALVDLPWLAVETVELLKSRGYNFVEIDYSERETLACNVLSLGERRLLALEENRKTNQKLRDTGFHVSTFPGSELCINGNGGPTCLTRPLRRS
ncbi:MAG TPA: arginine deiminase family protein [Terriglobales bacterium]|nr:arginine deiminase family protein [Terriglobales bacterium]